MAKLRCESYFACAEIDKWASPADIEKLQVALEEAGTPHRIEWYPGVEHGFAFPLRAGVYNKPAAERHRSSGSPAPRRSCASGRDTGSRPE